MEIVFEGSAVCSRYSGGGGFGSSALVIISRLFDNKHLTIMIIGVCPCDNGIYRYASILPDLALGFSFW